MQKVIALLIATVILPCYGSEGTRRVVLESNVIVILASNEAHKNEKNKEAAPSTPPGGTGNPIVYPSTPPGGTGNPIFTLFNLIGAIEKSNSRQNRLLSQDSFIL